MQYPISHVQGAFVLASGLTSSTNTVPVAFEIDGFDFDEILEGVQLVVDGHESLRTEIVQRRGRLEQRITRGGPVKKFIRRVDLRGSNNTDELLSTHMARKLDHAFDLTKAPLWRGFLAQVGDKRWVLGLAVAHVIIDGASVAVFSRDLASALAHGTKPNPPQLRSVAEREGKIRPTDAQVRWWRVRYAQRTQVETRWSGVARYFVEPIPGVPPRMVEGLTALSSELNASISTMFGAATALAATRVFGWSNPMLGFTTAQRDDANRRLFGPVHDHLPVAGGGRADVTFAEFVSGIHRRRAAARQYRLPTGILERIAGSSRVWTPYDIAVNYSPFAPPVTHELGGGRTVTARPIPTIGSVGLYRPTSVAPVVAAILRPNRDGSVTGDITGISKLHSAGDVRDFAGAVAAMLDQGLKRPNTPIQALVRR